LTVPSSLRQQRSTVPVDHAIIERSGGVLLSHQNKMHFENEN